MRIEVLGTSRMLLDDGTHHPLPPGKQGHLLQLLLLRPAEPVADDHLLAQLWPDVTTDVAARRLRVTVARLRHHLSGDIRLDRTSQGYRLAVTPASFDCLEFVLLAQQALGGDTDAATPALSLWRGEPYLGFVGNDDLQARRDQLFALRAEVQQLVASTGDRPARPPGHAGLGHAGLVPPTSEDAIVRTRLLDRIPPVGHVPLVLLDGPTGYGKTTLLTQWANREGPRIGWWTLQAGDEDPDVFWGQMRAALGAAAGDELRSDTARDRGTWTPTRLINWLVDTEPPLGLVIDGLHQLTNTVTLAQLRRFLQRSPDHVTVAVATRTRPPFPTARLEAGGRMLALTTDDLAFDDGETSGLLRQIDDGWDEHASAAHRLRTFTDGWPEAVTGLAWGLEPGDGVDDQQLANALEGCDDLLDRVLGGLTTRLREVLLDTAVLDRLDPDLCVAVTGQTDAAELLQTLDTRHHLLDRDEQGQRLRPILATMLRRRVADRDHSRTVTAHARAARHELAEGRADRALDHAIAGDHADLISESLGPALQDALVRADGTRLRRWLTATTPPNDADEAADLARLAATFLPPTERPRWFAHRSLPAREDVADAADALDLTRRGRCEEALAAVARVRAMRPDEGDGEPDPLSVPLDACIATAEVTCRLLLGHASAGGGELRHHRHRPTPWPWLTFMIVGHRALHDYVHGARDRAARRLEDAATQHPGLGPTWRRLADGSACVTAALLASDRAYTGRQHRQAIGAIEEAVERADVAERTPAGILGRYALHLAHRRAGNERAAATRLAEADAALAHHDGLVLLHAVRTRVCDTPDGRPATRLEVLSARELVVFDHLDSDLTLAQIGDALHLSVHTIKAHTRAIYRKLGVHRRSEAVGVAYATEPDVRRSR